MVMVATIGASAFLNIHLIKVDTVMIHQMRNNPNAGVQIIPIMFSALIGAMPKASALSFIPSSLISSVPMSR